MIKHIIAIYDRKAETYSDPKTFTTSAVAIRAFIDLMNPDQESNQYSLHPNDYALVAVGTFNDVSAKIVCTGKETLITGLEAQGLAHKENINREMRQQRAMKAETKHADAEAESVPTYFDANKGMQHKDP